MSLIKSLSVGLRLDASSFNSDVNAPINHLARLNSAASDAQGSISAIHSGDQGPINADAIALVTSQIARMGNQLKASFQAGFAPLLKIESVVSTELDKVGGTITTLARRIDAAMKIPGINQGFRSVEAGLSSFGQISGQVLTQFGSRLSPLGKLFLTLTRQVSNLGSGTARELRIAYNAFQILSAAGDVARKSLSQLTNLSFIKPIQSASALAKTMSGPVTSGVNAATGAVSGFLGPLAVALGFFGFAFKAVEFFKGGISGAISLEETLNKTNEVFGKSTGIVTSQVDKLAKSFGFVKGPLLDAASSIGLVGEGAGYSQIEAAKLSSTMLRLATDSVSFYNVPLDEALEKLRSGLVGESEPLRAFGVLLNEEAVTAEAFRLGLAKSKDELDDRAKVAARASLIEQGLAAASGDLAKTANSTANQFRKGEGGFENFATSIGTLLLPAVNAGIQAFNELQFTVIETIESNKGSIADFAEKLKQGFEFAGSVVRNFDLYWEISRFKITEFVLNAKATLATIPINLAIVGKYIATEWYGLVGDGINAVDRLFRNLGTNIEAFGLAVSKWLLNPTQAFEPKFIAVTEGIVATVSKLPDLVKPALVSLQDEIDQRLGQIADREQKRAKNLNAAGSRAKRPKALGPEKEKGELGSEGPKFSAALEVSSREAYSAIVKAQNGSSSTAVLRSVDQTGKQSLEVQRKTLDVLNRKVASVPFDIFSMA